jgi:hypothetical protein
MSTSFALASLSRTMKRRTTDCTFLESFHVSRLTFHGSWERTENDADGGGSFATVERSMSDRLRNVWRARSEPTSGIFSGKLLRAAVVGLLDETLGQV